ncbi:MAG: hypothetical protein ACOCSC_01575 [Candidatus Hadarchaeota archaeon]
MDQSCKAQLADVKEMEESFCFCCTSCQKHLPHHVCIITPDRPSPCGISWASAERRPKFYVKISKGRKIGDGEFEGVNRAIEELSDGEFDRAKLHSVLDHPLPSGMLQQVIIFYIPEQDGFGIVDKEYPGKTPLGMTFKEMEKMMLGRQVDGFLGASFSYLKSDNFIASEGGWDNIVWVSPRVEKLLRMATFAIR